MRRNEIGGFRSTADGRAGTPQRQLVRRSAAVVLSSVTVSAGMVAGAAPTSAQEPVYEITGDWVQPPDTIASGDPVVAEWRVNVNDGENPPANDPVDNVTAEFTLENGVFDEIPDMCLTEEVDPPSSISDDGATLTCNFGPVNMGTAIVVQIPVVADGETGDEISMGGSIDGQTVDLEPIEIINDFGMDIMYATNTNRRQFNETEPFVRSDVDMEWTLFMDRGSDPGPDSVTYELTVEAANGSAVELVPGGEPGTPEDDPCSAFQFGIADGHPWSAGNHPDEQMAPFVDSCTLTQTGPNTFELTLTGIDYSALQVPTHDSAGDPLPSDQVAIASGTLWFRVHTSTNTSLALESNAPTYTAPTGQTATDDSTNNRTTKAIVFPGRWSSSWIRPFTGSGGNPWDDSYRVSPGTEVRQSVQAGFGQDNAEPDDQYGVCQVLDSRYVTYESAVAQGFQVDGQYPLEYYVGNHPLADPDSATYDPDIFECTGAGFDPGGWTTDEPDDPETVKAVRVLFPFSEIAGGDRRDRRQVVVDTIVDPNVEIGQDIWSFGSALSNAGWHGPQTHQSPDTAITPTPGARYEFTNGRRDILRVIGAQPNIEKSAAKSTVRTGEPAEFTLTYSADGSGSIAPTVDGYEIVDTLPAGMTYEPGSADPEPQVSTSGGQQVLTWTLDDVPTNTENTLTYEAVADSSIEPGTPLTNTAVSSYGGASSDEVDETVTTTVNGFTIILKTSDVEYIPNDAGDGVGTGSWTVAIESVDPLPQAFTDTIDILPYNGDGRGTSFSGSYTLDEVVTPDGGTVYYTDEDPANLSDDPADPDGSNGSAGDITGNTVGWTTDRPENPTAVRVIGGELEFGETFSFQVVITTDGAEPQDTYVNRAQARAEHTELVMRTSAALVVTDYVVEKTSDPESGSTVEPGDTVTYTTTVTQQGPVPAGAALTDTLEDVLDDATYNDDVEADMGEVTFEDGVISWEGEVPVGEVATITYSVTVNDTDEPEEIFLKNVVSSVGCQLPEDCTTEHPGPGRYEVSKTSTPEPGSAVVVGETITYSVEITQRGRGPANDASITDDLSDVLDHASWNDDLEASAGEASLDGSTLTWTGDLAVEQVVTLTYSVTVTTVGDGMLHNLVTPGEGGTCVPAPDENPDCATAHNLGELPVTGASNTGTLFGAAGALLLAGLGLMTVARRRARPSQQDESQQLTNDPF